MVLGYSLAFSEENEWICGLGNFFMNSIGSETLSGSIPESLLATFQLIFAIITPALMIGSFVERIKFSAMLIFLSLWVLQYMFLLLTVFGAVVFYHLGERWTLLEVLLYMLRLGLLLW